MRNSKWLVASALAFVAAAAPGCGGTKCPPSSSSSSSDVIGPHALKKSSPMPGVVEIYRYGEGVRIGYVCLELASPGSSWWLLPAGTTPPVTPNSTLWTDDVVMHKISDEYLTGEQLCIRYANSLEGATLWHVVGTASVCPMTGK